MGAKLADSWQQDTLVIPKIRRSLQGLSPSVLWIVFLVPLALLAIIFRTILLRTPVVPFWDEWQTVDILHHYELGTLTFQDFWQFHNEHRIVIPGMIELGIIVFTHWNRQVEMTFDLCVAIAEAGFLLAAARRILRSTTWMLALIAPGSLLLFSLSQYQNWLWSFQLTFILTVFGAALCVMGFSHQPARWAPFLLALVGAVVAALSSVGGVMAFIAFVPSAWRAGRIKLAVWIVTALAVLIPYFIGFPHSVPISISLDLFTFAFGYLGAPLGYPNAPAAIFWGIVSVVLVALNLVVYWRRERTFTALDPWIGLALFALAIDGITALGRGAYYTGPYAGLGSLMIWGTRYQTFATLWWISLLVLLAVNVNATWSRWQERRNASPTRNTRPAQASRAPVWQVAVSSLMTLNVIALLAMTVALVGVNKAAYTPMQQYMYPQFLLQSCVVDYQFAPADCLDSYAWDVNYVRIQAAVLDEYHMGPFYNQLGSTRPLVRYRTPQGGYLITTDLIDPSTGYQIEQWLGSVYDAEHPNTRLLYNCQTRASHAQFVSTDAHCTGQVVQGTLGWVYTSPPWNPVTVPLYSCARQSDYFVSTSPSCEGQKTIQLLGYAIAQVYGYRG